MMSERYNAAKVTHLVPFKKYVQLEMQYTPNFAKCSLDSLDCLFALHNTQFNRQMTCERILLSYHFTR